ncbi:MAG: D-alanyl-D-alanine carboxypeptidase [Acidobacteria bacterium]|nr:D-alanyl-D-alanine carboxypeptidase [Acidobacteriota bacterium]
MSRVILALGVLLSSLAGVHAQDARPATAPPSQQQRPQQPASTPETQRTRPVFTTPIVVPSASEEYEPQMLDEQPPLQQSSFSRQGVLVETLDGATVSEQSADQSFNPASAIKLTTALAALRMFGPQHRFATVVWINGKFDKATGTVRGDLVISGSDPSLHSEHAVAMSRELNQLGIRTVTGDLIVAPRFSMNFSSSALRSGESFYDTLDAMRRPASATRAWNNMLFALGDQKRLQTAPSVAVMGAVYVDSVPQSARVVLTHYSAPLVDVLKVLLCYSNNFMAERLGDALGGPQSVHRMLTTELGLNAAGTIRIASTSGLGVNRLTPRQMLKVYRALLDELRENNLKADDILPVAGVDPGTLQRRYSVSAGRGSIIAKTGTLSRTDGGVSALVGQFRTQSGETLLFVIFNQRGNVSRFRATQDMLISGLQQQHGGPAPFAYTPHTLAMRLASSDFDGAKFVSDEYEQN